MNLADVISIKYPGKLEQNEIKIQDDGQGPYIKQWTLQDPEPTAQEISEWLSDPLLYTQLVFNDVVTKLDNHLNQIAKDRQYNDAVSLVSYKDCGNPIWEAEANTFIAWRTSVWEYAFTIKQQVIDGEIPLPTVDEFFASLPKIEWPE